MLFYLLPQLAELPFLGAERDALHHVPHGGGQPDGALAISLLLGPG